MNIKKENSEAVNDTNVNTYFPCYQNTVSTSLLTREEERKGVSGYRTYGYFAFFFLSFDQGNMNQEFFS